MLRGKRFVVVLVGAALLLAAALVPGVTEAKKPNGYQLCDDGTFHVLHKGDTLVGYPDADLSKKKKKVGVAQGYYKTYVYAAGEKDSSLWSPTCYQASVTFHNFLGAGNTGPRTGYNPLTPWMPNAWRWSLHKGMYKNWKGKKNQSWKQAINLTMGCDACGFEGGIIFRKVAKPS